MNMIVNLRTKILNSLYLVKRRLKAYRMADISGILNEDFGLGNNKYLCELIVEMINEGAIELLDEHYKPSDQKVTNIDDLINEFHIGLTHKGGKLWERAFEVNWDCFWDYSAGDYKGLDDVLFVSAHEQFSIEFYQFLTQFRGVIQLDPIQEQKDYQVLYWKKLKEVNTIDFLIDPDVYLDFEKACPDLEWRKTYAPLWQGWFNME